MFICKFRSSVIKLPRKFKSRVVILSDFLMAAVFSWLALVLYQDVIIGIGITYLYSLSVSVALLFPIFIYHRIYRVISRYAGLQIIYILFRALSIYGALYFIVFSVIGVSGIPRSLGLIQPMMLALGVLTSRLLARYWLSDLSRRGKRENINHVLIYGAGSAGRQLAMGLNQSVDIRVVGFVDDDERLQGQVLNGLEIYSFSDLQHVVRDAAVSQILLAMPSSSRRRRLEIIDALKALPVHVLTLPGLMDITSGKVSITDLKELDIEDLLGRDSVPPNSIMLAKNIAGKVVLVTGAGGSIGSELCRQIVKIVPERLLILELSEFALYAIEQELLAILSLIPDQKIELVPLLGNVRDAERMSQIMSTWNPHTVYHAAAYKHVPIVEHNPAEGVLNNVCGTWVLAELAMKHGISDFVLISTDKAVRPTNIMGASKRLAEMILQGLAGEALQHNKTTTFSMVRFGNVLGSSGSVVPLFRKQIMQGGPVTLTDKRITRYFMTIPEAAQLVIQAGAMATGGDVFVLDMGESVKIIDLARKMIELSGLSVQDEANPDGDIAIAVTGLRPGEKLYEELLIGDNPQPTQHTRIMKAHEEFLHWSDLQPYLKELIVAIDVNDIPRMRTLIQRMVSGYQPDANVVDRVYLAQRDLK